MEIRMAKISGKTERLERSPGGHRREIYTYHASYLGRELP